MKQAIREAEIESLLSETSTDRKHLQIGLENQKVTLPECEDGLRIDYRIVHNIHKNHTTQKWQGFVNNRSVKLGVEYKPTGIWNLIGENVNKRKMRNSRNSGSNKTRDTNGTMFLKNY